MVRLGRSRGTQESRRRAGVPARARGAARRVRARTRTHRRLPVALRRGRAQLRVRAPHGLERRLAGRVAQHARVEEAAQHVLGRRAVLEEERDLVAGLSLGEATARQALKFVPYYQGKALQPPIEISPRHGDVYIMSHKAIGSDCAKRSVVTWRHARGAT